MYPHKLPNPRTNHVVDFPSLIILIFIFFDGHLRATASKTKTLCNYIWNYGNDGGADMIEFIEAEIWDALRAAAEATDLALAQAIVDSAGIIITSADMTTCYDERGRPTCSSVLSFLWVS